MLSGSGGLENNERFCVKIAVVVTIPGSAGTQQAAALTAEALACVGHEVTLLLPDGKDSVVVENCPSVKAFPISSYFPTLVLMRYLKRPLFALKLRKRFENCVSELKQHLNANHFDVLLTVHPTAFMAVRRAAGGRFPIAAMMSRIDASHVRLMRKADALIVTTEEMQSFAVNNGIQPECCHILPHCVVDRCQPIPVGIHQPVRLGGMARLEANKGMAAFVAALGLLKNRNIDFTATIAGRGKERNKLISMCQELGLQDMITFPGWLDGSGKEQFFQSIDILVQPAWRDSFGIILVEGMARGLPIVSGNTVGARYILTNGEDGLIFEPHDKVVLADCLEEIIKDHKKAKQLGRNARATFEKRFTTEAIGICATKILESVSSKFERS